MAGGGGGGKGKEEYYNITGNLIQSLSFSALAPCKFILTIKISFFFATWVEYYNYI